MQPVDETVRTKQERPLALTVDRRLLISENPRFNIVEVREASEAIAAYFQMLHSHLESGPSDEGLATGYLELLRKFPLASIRDDEHLKEACKVVTDLAVRAEELDEGQTMYFDALTDLVENYEDRNIEMTVPPGRDMLRSFLDDQNVSQTELAEATGVSKSNISEILSGKREISKRQMRLFADFFRTEPAVFLGPMEWDEE